jgi:hypothetical protein
MLRQRGFGKLFRIIVIPSRIEESLTVCAGGVQKSFERCLDSARHAGAAWTRRISFFLVVVPIGDTYAPRTSLTDKATAMGVWIFYTLFVGIAFLVEKIGYGKQTKMP